METETSENASSSDEDEFIYSSADDSEDFETLKYSVTEVGVGLQGYAVEPTNVEQKLFNRESSGCFSGNWRSRHLPPVAYNDVPNRLVFCLKDIVPKFHLKGHIFMGLTACGQFLLSYKVAYNDNMAVNPYIFNVAHKYTLYFWLYKPHTQLRSFYKCRLFDDHGVDNAKEVTMTQWKCGDPRVLIVHGAACEENEDSYITYVKVPKLGCSDCKKVRESDCEDVFRWYALCLKCNLTIHTKYSTTESDRRFDPYTNLICPGRILIVANGFVHMLLIDLELPATVRPQLVESQHNASASPFSMPKATPPYESAWSEGRAGTSEAAGSDNHIVARIIADFSDIESESPHSTSSRQNEMHRSITNNDSSPSNVSPCIPRKMYDELIFTCNSGSPTAINKSSAACSNAPTCSQVGGTTNVSLVSHQAKRHRIVTKSFRNCVTTVDMQGTSTSSVADKSNAYEFSEDNEKCEKIATLRKRRLADKKYEFSEDNSENIVPFTKVRSANRSRSTSLFNTHSAGLHSARSLQRQSAANNYYHNSPCASPSSSPRPSYASSSGDLRHCTPPPLLRASPIALQQGFRSPPCSSPVGAGYMRSPGRHAYNQKSPSQSLAAEQLYSFKPHSALSPLQVSLTKRSQMEFHGCGSMSPNAFVPLLSPRTADEARLMEVPLLGGTMAEKPVCIKKFQRRFVEEDDAASVITSEEDDCISPGYHTSLPVEVHGSCYSEMQMISQASYHQLRCASAVITQHSFDLETFTYHVISTLCQKNQKAYDVFYDWACEIITICPISNTIICLLMAIFSARDLLTTTNCLNCTRKIDCIFHRRNFECRILFTWNMDSGDWEVLDYGELVESKSADLINPLKRWGNNGPPSLAHTAKKLAQEMAISLNRVQDYSSNLRVLDSNLTKSKVSIRDHDNQIEFYR